ncbi:hypothetical protein JCM8547_002940 [Rhodosporidiobolus lusitaniae]
MSSRPSRSRAPSIPSRPTTPLRRLSSYSLKHLSLSHSASRRPLSAPVSLHTSHPDDPFDPDEEEEDPLGHLSDLFDTLAKDVQDLTANLQHLEGVHHNLQETNEAFASLLLGLRANSYTIDFLEAPTKLNFDLASERASARFAADQAARAESAFLASQNQHPSPPASPSASIHGGGGGGGGGLGETTFVTNDEESFVTDDAPSRTGGAGGKGGAARGRGTGVRGGRGASAAGRGGKGGPLNKRRKEEMAAFADPILPLLPITLRENRRQECEKVLWALKERGEAKMADLVTSLSSGLQPVPQVRINEVLLALVRAKVVSKALVKGVAVYRLDPSKCG